jgi:ubiquinol-cytochrome c reductase cytochrome b subunit
MFMIAGVLCLLGGLAQINPVWLYGPYQPYQVSSAAQPDWYMGWLEGALRIFPNWEIHLFGHTVGNLFFPAAVLPGVTFGLLYAWPWLEARRTKDRAVHNICDRPRQAPVRTGMGVAAIAFYSMLFVGGGTDVVAVTLNLSENAIIWFIRVGVVVVPAVSGYIAYRLCRELAAVPDAGRRHPPAVVVWEPGMGYVSHEAPEGPDGRGGDGAAVEEAAPVGEGD